MADDNDAVEGDEADTAADGEADTAADGEADTAADGNDEVVDGDARMLQTAEEQIAAALAEAIEASGMTEEEFMAAAAAA